MMNLGMKNGHIQGSLEVSPGVSSVYVQPPTSPDLHVLLTDYYQLTMAFSYWKNKRHEDPSIFELYFRKCPFDGEFAIFAGLNEIIDFIKKFKFSTSDVQYIKAAIPNVEDEFLDYLLSIDGNCLSVFGINEGTIVFASEPLIRLEGPLAICQLLETIIINLTNFPSLVATNASRYRLAAGWDKTLLEFGLRRAQGPNGAMSASRYTYLGGFDGTSNVMASKLFGIPVSGTHSHSYVSSYTDLSMLATRSLGSCEDFVQLVLDKKTQIKKICPTHFISSKISMGELTAFIAYAQAFPDGFLCLLDTFDTLYSGLPNFLSVSLALVELGHRPIGVRMDSGDLAYLSKEVRKLFIKTSEVFGADFTNLKIVVSNNVNERIIYSLNNEENEIDVYGIGTHLVTCHSQPALGMVYKLVELNGQPCMKLSQEFEKITLPLAKNVYRLYNSHGAPLADLIEMKKKPAPNALDKIYCRHLFDETKRCFIIPTKVETILKLIWNKGEIVNEPLNLEESRKTCINQLKLFRDDHLRYQNPTPYKLTYSGDYYDFFHNIYNKLTPVKTIF